MLQNLTGSISLFSSTDLLKGAVAKTSFSIIRISHTWQNKFLSLLKSNFPFIVLNVSPSHGTCQITGFKMIKNSEACSCFFKNMQAEISWCVHVRSHTTENAPVCILLFASIVSRKTLGSSFS